MSSKVRVSVELDPWQWRVLLVIAKDRGFAGRIDRERMVQALVDECIRSEVEAIAEYGEVEKLPPGALGVYGWAGRRAARE